MFFIITSMLLAAALFVTTVTAAIGMVGCMLGFSRR
jgi:hypothetical protein